MKRACKALYAKEDEITFSGAKILSCEFHVATKTTFDVVKSKLFTHEYFNSSLFFTPL